jgi:hypothetical protein
VSSFSAWPPVVGVTSSWEPIGSTTSTRAGSVPSPRSVATSLKGTSPSRWSRSVMSWISLSAARPELGRAHVQAAFLWRRRLVAGLFLA